MKFSRISPVLGAAVTALLPVTAFAQVYGDVEIGFQASDLRNIQDAVIDADELTSPTYSALNGSVGYTFSGNYFVQLDHQLTAALNLDDDNDNDAFRVGRAYTLRGGYMSDAFTANAFVGTVTAWHDDDSSRTSIRHFYGVEGSYVVTPEITLFGHLGVLDGTGGDDDDGEDAIREATIAQLGAAYSLGENVEFSGYYALGRGIMDDDNPATDEAVVDRFALRADYSVSQVPGLSLFAEYATTTYFQGNENDEIGDNAFTLGLTYAFGASGSAPRTSDLSYIDDWVARTGGLLE